MTNPFYSSDEAERSRAVLDEVVATVPDAILIGGWGTWVRTKGPMSHDIDLIVSRQDLSLLEGLVDDMSTLRHLAGAKWRGTWRSIHLDLYVPYQSRLGANLQLRAENLQVFSQTLDGYRVLTVPAHTATKIAALLDRPDSLPGCKDRQEILALLKDPATVSAPTVIRVASERSSTEVGALIGRAFTFLAEGPDLGRKQRAQLRQVEAIWQHSLAEAVERGLAGDRRQGPDRHTGLGL